MSRVFVSEEDLRDRIVNIAETIGTNERLDEDELQHVGREAFHLSSDAKKLRQQREDGGDE